MLRALSSRRGQSAVPAVGGARKGIDEIHQARVVWPESSIDASGPNWPGKGVWRVVVAAVAGRASTDGVGMWERGAALAAAGAILERAQRSAGHSLFIIGEAGLGKTTILDHLSQLAQGCRLGRSRG